MAREAVSTATFPGCSQVAKIVVIEGKGYRLRKWLRWWGFAVFGYRRFGLPTIRGAGFICRTLSSRADHRDRPAPLTPKPQGQEGKMRAIHGPPEGRLSSWRLGRSNWG